MAAVGGNQLVLKLVNYTKASRTGLYTHNILQMPTLGETKLDKTGHLNNYSFYLLLYLGASHSWIYMHDCKCTKKLNFLQRDHYIHDIVYVHPCSILGVGHQNDHSDSSVAMSSCPPPTCDDNQEFW